MRVSDIVCSPFPGRTHVRRCRRGHTNVSIAAVTLITGTAAQEGGEAAPVIADRSQPARNQRLHNSAPVSRCYRSPQWVKMRNTHAEHNRSALTLIPDVPSDMDFRRNGARSGRTD